MKEQDAIMLLKDVLPAYITDDSEEADHCKEAVSVAIAALEKAIPKEPWHTRIVYKDGDEWITDECPYCADHLWEQYGIWDRLVDAGTKYCRRCGQAIDWNWTVRKDGQTD